MSDERYIDSQCILIEKDIEKSEYVDYVYTSDVRGKDPRYKDRNMVIGTSKGLFRINKNTLEPELLRPIDLDPKNRCFMAASTKVLKIYRSENEFPEKTVFQSG
jgi:hypothetical protein